MGSTALEETEEGHDQVHPVASPDYPVARRSSLNSERSSLVRLSGFSSVPTGACMFSLVMLALILTWPSDFGVGAVNFTFNGFKENDVFSVSDSSWILDSSTSCIYFDPPNASGSISVADRFLNRGLVQMRDPVSKKVKSFNTSFIYQIRIPPGNHATGPGMAFIIVPDDVTVGAPGDNMGLLTATPKNFKSDDHTFGVELDTYMNLEFNDPSENHIGINLASMNSTYTCKPDYNLASKSKDIYQQIWIDYFEADSRMDLSYAFSGQGKPDTPQGSQRELDLSLLFNENMYIGFSSAKGKESDNVPSICAWSFSNDGPSASPDLIGLDVLPASPPSSLSLQAPAPAPASGHSTLSRSLLAFVFITVSICTVSVLMLYCWKKNFRHPFRIFIFHAGGEDGPQKSFVEHLNQRITKRRWLKLGFCVKTFTNVQQPQIDGYIVDNVIFYERSARSGVAIVVVSRDFFECKRTMLELHQLMILAEGSRKELGKSGRILPLFYKLTPDEIRRDLTLGYWEAHWEKMTVGYPALQVSEYQEAVKWLSSQPGIIYNSSTHSDEKEYIDDVVKAVYKIFYEERWYPLFPSCLRGAMTATAKRESKRLLSAVGKSSNRARAPLRARKKIGVMTYIQKLLHLLFALSGLLIMLFSVILDNSFNHKPQRFIAFAILAPVMIFLGILVSGWFPHIPLWLIAFLKQRGFLKHVSACSPWHDNIVTDFCGEICPLEPLEEDEGTAFLELHQPLRSFLYGISSSPQGNTLALESQGATSTLEPEGECLHQTSILQPQNEDLHISISPDHEDASTSEIIRISPTTTVSGQASLPNFQEASFPGEDIVIPVYRSSKFYDLDVARVPMLTLKGPKINGYVLEVQCFKNMSSVYPTFDLTCTFRNKRTKEMFLTSDKLQNLAQNMSRWVENPHPIVTDKSSHILHCLAIQNILSEFTKVVFSFKPFRVQHRYLAGRWKVKPWVVLLFVVVCFSMSLIPLLSDKKSYYYLFFLIFLIPYLLTSKDINPLYFYNLRELLCPVFIFIWTFSKLYLSRSSCIWCNEFRKQRVVNPQYFWIDGVYSNNLFDREACFNVDRSVLIPDNPIIQSLVQTCQGQEDPSDHTNIPQSFSMICLGWHDPSDPTGDPPSLLKQHDCKLRVYFDSIEQTWYINVTLYFYENDDLLDQKHYSRVETSRLYLIEKLFCRYTDPSFGGYVERICPGFWPGTYLAHSPRFLDICDRIITNDRVPTFAIANRVCTSKFIIGVPFCFSNPEVE